MILIAEPAFTGDQYLAVALHGNLISVISASADVRDDDAVTATKGRVQRAVAVVADDGEIPAGTDTVARDQDLAVVLHGYAAAATGSDARGGDAVATAEAGVQRAIDVVADQCNVIVGACPDLPGDQDLAVVLHEDVVALVGPSSDIGNDDTVATAER